MTNLGENGLKVGERSKEEWKEAQEWQLDEVGVTYNKVGKSSLVILVVFLRRKYLWAPGT